jgi:hypothetical protein
LLVSKLLNTSTKTPITTNHNKVFFTMSLTLLFHPLRCGGFG